MVEHTKLFSRFKSARDAVVVLLTVVVVLLTGCLTDTPAVPASTATIPIAADTAAEIATNTTATTLDAYPASNEAIATAAYPEPATPIATMSPPTGYPAAALPTPTEETTTNYPPPAPITSTSGAVYFPVIGPEVWAMITPTETPTPTVAAVIAGITPAVTPPPLPTATPTPVTPIDFNAARADLNAQGRDLVYNKIGFHVTFQEDRQELDSYMAQLDANGVPFFLKSVDNAEPVYKAQELMKQSGVGHTLVFRSTAYDVPQYDLPPEQAAELDWEAEKALWPPELDPQLVWFETINEPDKTRAEWLARFSLRKAQLALRDGYRWAAFGWASGEPEPADWQSPAMLELLRLIGEHPDQLAIALHEYSYLAEDIGHEYPYKVGRFLELFRIADRNGIPRPTILITEWGWTYNDIPPTPAAMADIDWAARLYGAFPEIKGAAIWNLGKVDKDFLNLNDQVQGLIAPLTAYSLTTYFSAPRPPERTTLDPQQFPPPAQ